MTRHARYAELHAHSAFSFLDGASQPEELVGLVADEDVKQIVLAILMESPATLESRWLATGNRFPLAFIARGDAFCDELVHAEKEDPDKTPWNVICAGLRRRKAERRLQHLDALMKRGEASMENLAEMTRLAAGLKRGKSM